jgi:hypothetical protein
MSRMYAWTAVVRGAVIRGLEGEMIISRKARMYYVSIAAFHQRPITY